MRLAGEPVHAVLPGAVPVALLDVLVQEDGNGQDEGTYDGRGFGRQIDMKTKVDLFFQGLRWVFGLLDKQDLTVP